MYCGDCLSIIPELKLDEVDLLLTDPPYGINVIGGSRKKIRGGGPFGGVKNAKRGSLGAGRIVSANTYDAVYGDDSEFDPEHLLNVGKNQIIFGGNYFASKLPESKGWLVWNKVHGLIGTSKNYSDFEMAWTSFNRPSRIFGHTWSGLIRASETTEKRCHPTQKPIQLFVDIIKYCARDASLILDPYMGSGGSSIGL